MADYGKHYLALGLRPGATQKEIQSAFRRMAKLYHPDQDSSLDGKMRYLEARQAYDVLRERRDTQPPKPTPPPNPDAGSEKTTTCGSGWYSYDDEYVLKDDSVFDFEKFTERIPFSLEEAPKILRKSIEEIAGVGMYIRVLLHVAAMWVLFSLMGYGVVITLVVISCSLVGFAFFRYYFSSDPTSYIFANFAGSYLYSAVLSYLLINSLNISLLFRSWYVVASVIMCALLLLWARPLTWIARASREISS